MNAALGHTGVLLALAASVTGTCVLVYGLVTHRSSVVRSGRVYAWVALAGAVLATFAMERALITHDFSIVFVAQNNSRSTPLLYTITGMWSALAGSILLWGLILAGFVAVMVWQFRRSSADPLVGWATLVTYVVTAFFFGLMAGPSDPFTTVTGTVPTSGLGPNVLLQDNPLVAFHPPLLYMGFVGFTIPFAFAIASLITGRVGEIRRSVGATVGAGSRSRGETVDAGSRSRGETVDAGSGSRGETVDAGSGSRGETVDAGSESRGETVVTWQAATRRWTLFAWGFLTVGIVLGAWWSYQVLGWGGFWAWDPVENASILPWLCATAYLHSAMVQERRGILRVWNLSLIVATFSLTILGTFLTRSGVITSVHAFSDSDIGPVLLAFFALVLLSGVGLIAWRGDRLRSEGSIDSPVSREGAFLANNLLFVALAFIVLLGTVFPLLYEALRGQQVTVGAPYFDTMTLPIGLALLLLMAIGPALPWRKTNASTMAERLLLPAACGVAIVVVCVAAGVRGLGPLCAFGLGGFAASANIRQLVLSSVASHRHGAGAWRGLIGRANGGMVVHVGIVVIAVALAAATSFGHRSEVTLRPGGGAVVDGQRITFEGLTQVRTSAKDATEALVLVNGHGPFRPAISQFGSGTDPVGTPAIDSNPFEDVYLTIDTLPASGPGPVGIGVTVQPLVAWLWAGGLILVLGSALAALPGKRRRPTDPISAPLPSAVASKSGDGSQSGLGSQSGDASQPVDSNGSGRAAGDPGLSDDLVGTASS